MGRSSAQRHDEQAREAIAIARRFIEFSVFTQFSRNVNTVKHRSGAPTRTCGLSLDRPSPIIAGERSAKRISAIMQLRTRRVGCWLILGFLAACGAAAQSLPTITQTGFTVKVPNGQVSGPCDWASWDPRTPPVKGANGIMTYGIPGPCNQTAGQSDTASQVLGQGLGYAFEDTANP